MQESPEHATNLADKTNFIAFLCEEGATPSLLHHYTIPASQNSFPDLTQRGSWVMHIWVVHVVFPNSQANCLCKRKDSLAIRILLALIRVDAYRVLKEKRPHLWLSSHCSKMPLLKFIIYCVCPPEQEQHTLMLSLILHSTLDRTVLDWCCS